MIMIERIARAMYSGGMDIRPSWGKASAEVREAYLSDARAAWEAIAEPTDAMIQGALVPEQKDDEWAKTIPRDIWRAMHKAGCDQ